MKIKQIKIPGLQQIIEIFEKNVNKLNIAKFQKKNWNEEDIQLLFWIVDKYCKLNSTTHKHLSEQDWKTISAFIPSKSTSGAQFKWLQMQKTSVTNQPWTKDEDQILIKLVQQYGKSWSNISKQLYNGTGNRFFRTAKQCRERYNNHLDPNIKKGYWT